MRILTRLTILAFCIMFCGSAKESIYLEYSIENLTTEKLLDRQIQKSETGFPLDIHLNSTHSKTEIKSLSNNQLYTKGQKSYSQKNTLY